MFFHHFRASCVYVIFVAFVELKGENDKTDSSVAPKTIEIIEKKLPFNVNVNSSKSGPKSVQKYPYYRGNTDQRRIKDRLSNMTLLKRETGFNIYHYQINPKMDINSELWSSPINFDNFFANPTVNGSNKMNGGNVQNLQKRYSDRIYQNNLSRQNIRETTHNKNNNSYYSDQSNNLSQPNNKIRQATGNNDGNEGYHNDRISNNNGKTNAYDNDRISNINQPNYKIRHATHNQNNEGYHNDKISNNNGKHNAYDNDRISYINPPNNKIRHATHNQNNEGYNNDRISNNNDKTNAYDNDRISYINQPNDRLINNVRNTRQYPDDRFSNIYNSYHRIGPNIPRLQQKREDDVGNEINGHEHDRFDNNGQKDYHLYTFSDRFIRNLQKYEELIEEWNEVLRVEETKRIERDGKANKGRAAKGMTRKSAATKKKTTARKPLNLGASKSKFGKEPAAEEESEAGEDFQEVVDFVAHFNITMGPPRTTTSTGFPSRHWYKHVLDETAVRRALQNDPYMQRLRKLYFMKMADYKRRVGGIEN